jgi:hypothetical protein
MITHAPQCYPELGTLNVSSRNNVAARAENLCDQHVTNLHRSLHPHPRNLIHGLKHQGLRDRRIGSNAGQRPVTAIDRHRGCNGTSWVEYLGGDIVVRQFAEVVLDTGDAVFLSPLDINGTTHRAHGAYDGGIQSSISAVISLLITCLNRPLPTLIRIMPAGSMCGIFSRLSISPSLLNTTDLSCSSFHGRIVKSTLS